MSTRICLLPLIGLPASGKTTFSNWLLDISQKPINIIHICFDDYLTPPTNEKSSKFEFKQQRNSILSRIRELIYELKYAGNIPTHLSAVVKSSLCTDLHDFVVLCDDNNYYRSMRYKFYQLAKENACAYAQIYFDCELKLTFERNSLRPAMDRVSEETMQRMAKRLETPDPTTHHWELNTYTMSDCENYNVIRTRILAFLTKTFENMLQPMPVQSKLETIQSLVHQLDLLLRRRIGEIIQTEQLTTKRQIIAKALNIKRKELLQNVKIKAELKEISFNDLNEYVNMLY
ncbi:L-seryl-tRNA(Sec) kinase [Rhagoletis pomonella]|uniref:L-seryl-tRNA(Sec) kinase n=1 Tax=Rhagoletis pomonella TaxID=28610 RepID=UPI00177E1680|nr:L-seryl-tRNA(Sec) kinase [Rhagoletis pomonella]